MAAGGVTGRGATGAGTGGVAPTGTAGATGVGTGALVGPSGTAPGIGISPVGGGPEVGRRGALRTASFSSGVARRISSVIRAASIAVPITRGVMSNSSSVFCTCRSLSPNR